MRVEMASEVRELAPREGDGLEVSLLWSPADDGLTVVCSDLRTGDWFALDAEPANALDIFEHPYAYAAKQGVGYRLPAAGCTEALAA